MQQANRDYFSWNKNREEKIKWNRIDFVAKPFFKIQQKLFPSCALMHKIIVQCVDLSLSITKSITPGVGVWCKIDNIIRWLLEYCFWNNQPW